MFTSESPTLGSTVWGSIDRKFGWAYFIKHQFVKSFRSRENPMDKFEVLNLFFLRDEGWT